MSSNSPDKSANTEATTYRVTAVLLGVLAVIAAGFVLAAAKAVLIPLVIAWLLSYLLGPVVTALARRKIPTGPAVTLIGIFLVGICYLAGVFLYGRVAAFAAEYPKYQLQLKEIVDILVGKYQLKSNPFEVVDWGPKVGTFVVSLSGSVVNFATNLFLVVIFLIFMLLGKPFSEYKIKKAFSPENAEKIASVLSSISGQISRYLAIQFMISLVTGFLVWLALRIIGVDFAITWGAVAFFLNFIPTIGSVVASIPPILLAWVQFYPEMWPAIITLIAVLAIQQIMGNVVAPKVMGDRLNLSPVVVLLSLVFWGWLWGPVGAVLSVPLVSTIKIICQHIEPLRPISIMMESGKPLRREFD